MGLPLGCRYLSVLQVAFIVICYRGKVSSERVQGCVGSQLTLLCKHMKVVNVTAVVLGDSYGIGSVCYIRDNDCIHNANASNTVSVSRRCDYRHNCTVRVVREQIPCLTWKPWRLSSSWSYFYNDFERITYDCIDDPRNATTTDSTYDDSMEDDNSPEFKPGFGTESARGCVASQLRLSCPEMEAIEVIDVVIGYSYGVSTVCNTSNMSDSNCTQIANANHTIHVHSKCDGQSICTVDVLQEDIDCGQWDSGSQNDFELITYNCLNDSRNYLTSTDGRLSTSFNNTKAEPVTNESISQVVIVVLAIICPIILLAIILLAVVMYRRKQGAHVKTPLDPVAMTEVDNHQNEYDICANETQGTSLHGDNDPQPMYSQIEESDYPKRGENQIIYSEVELRGAIWKDGEKTSETKAAAVESSTQPQTGTVSKPSSPQDDGCQIVIENDLYGMADNYAKDTAVEPPIRSLAGAVSKTPSPQDDEGLTLIENDIYCH